MVFFKYIRFILYLYFIYFLFFLLNIGKIYPAARSCLQSYECTLCTHGKVWINYREILHFISGSKVEIKK